jgi:hypothetical protein
MCRCHWIEVGCTDEKLETIHARADIKKMGIRPELWLNDSVKGTELPTSRITILKHEKEFCVF